MAQDEDKTFRLRTNRPDVVEFRHRGQVPIAAKKTGYMKLRFFAPPEGTRAQVLLFVNNEENQNEECLVITVEAG